MTEQISRFSNISPTDYRYKEKRLLPFLSEEGFVQYKSKVEGALAHTQADRGLISRETADEISRAALDVPAEEVYEEEDKIRHDVIAQKNRTVARVSHAAKPAVHRPSTSFDKVEPANAARYRDAFEQVILPDSAALARQWIGDVRQYKDMLQIGRTHLQHAEPITYGFTLAWYLHRFCERVQRMKEAVGRLQGKFSGSVGAYNASSIFFDDPEEFEREVLSKMGLKPAELSTQIAPMEPTLDLVHYTISAFGVLANWADDMRNLMRPEIAEVGMPRGSADTSTSSIMPHKLNPVGPENVKSLWKEAMPRIITVYIDQISDHQRDLTNSASQRYIPEIFDIFDYAVTRAARSSGSIKPHPENMKKNFMMSADKIISEPLHILLSAYGHPGAHKCVEGLVEKSYKEGKSLTELAMSDPSLQPYISKFTQKQASILKNPEQYTGIAASKAAKVADAWDARLKGMGF